MVIQGVALTYKNDSNFAREFRKLIINRIQELVNESEKISTSSNPPNYKRVKLDQHLNMIEHNMSVYATFFKSPYGQRESILESVKLLYRMH